MTRSLVAALSIGLVATLLAQRSSRYDYEEVVEKRYEVEPGQSLVLRSDRGSVRILGTNDREVFIRVLKGVDDVSKRRAKSLFERFALEFRRTSRGVEIIGEYDRPGGWFRRDRLQVEYEIRVPREFNVEVKTSGGSIDVREIRGEASVKTSGGWIKVIDVAGPVMAKTSGGSITAEKIDDEAELRTSGGSITVREVQGPVVCKTSGGSITAEEVRGDLEAHTSGGGMEFVDIYGTVNASTSGGSIYADVAVQPAGPMTLKTSGGSITLRLGPDVKVDINAKTSGGRVRTDLPVMVQGEIGRGRLQGSVNGGGPLITLKTSGGSIRIQER
jgi:hypothetical protein